jgi:guanine nucleotide-binding protein subunit alpha
MTTQILETTFTIGRFPIRMLETPKQILGTEKWIHSFENITIIVFCIDLACYDQMLPEDFSQNRMMKSLVFFDWIVNSQRFIRTSVVLIFCKVGLFREKLGCSPLSNCFPDYSGGNDINSALNYILRRFTQANRAHLNLYPHMIDSNTSVIENLLKAIKETVLYNALTGPGGLL